MAKYNAMRDLAIDSQWSTIPLKRVLILVLFSCLLAACFQPETGCLDIEATNFAPVADENCGADDSGSGCPCTYPNLSLRLEYLVDKVAYEPNTFYRINNQFIRLTDIQFYLSGFQFHQLGGDWISVADTITLVFNEPGIGAKDSIFTDDFQLINRQSSIVIGAVKQSGQFDSIRFLVGLDPQANKVLPDSITNTNHPLADTDRHTGDESGYLFNSISLRKDTLPNTDEIILNVIGNTNLGSINLPFSYETPPGTNFSIGTLAINHAKWFDGINFDADNDAVMIGKIVANTPNVFSIPN